MAVTESRVRNGSLRIKDKAGAWHVFSCTPTSIAITPGEETGGDGTDLELLCGDLLTDAGEEGNKSATLDITAVADFLDPAGLIALSFKEPGDHEFEWAPNLDKDPNHIWRGTVTVSAIQVGGEVGARLLPTLSWGIKTLFLPQSYGGGQWLGPRPTGFTAPTGPALEWKVAPVGAMLPETLAELKAHGTLGDAGRGRPSRSFTTGEFVTLGDGLTKVSYKTAGGWAAGAAT